MSDDPLVSAMNTKQECRRHFRQRRQQQISLGSAIYRQVLTMVQSSPIRPGYLGLYWPLSSEVDLRPIRAITPNAVALPVADGSGGLLYRCWRDTPMQADGCGIPAPTDAPALRADQLSLLLVPALAIDHSGIRLGYGGGLYAPLRAHPLWAARAAGAPGGVCAGDRGWSPPPYPSRIPLWSMASAGTSKRLSWSARSAGASVGAGMPQPSACKGVSPQHRYWSPPEPSATGSATAFGVMARMGRRSTSLISGQYNPRYPGRSVER